MSTFAAQKPAATNRDSNSATTSSSSPSRATPRSATANSTPVGGSASPTHARSRSLRSSTPTSARAAAAGQRRESPLSGTNGPNGKSASVDAEEAARAETAALLDGLKNRLAKAENASEDYRKQAEVLQSRLEETAKEQIKYEEKCHEHEEQIEALQNDKREATRTIRELETIYEAEHVAMAKEKVEMSNREEELQMIIARLKDSLNQKMSKDDNDDEPRSSRSLNPTSPGLEGGSFVPPASPRSDSRNQSKLVMQKDKLIESLRLELAEAQIKLAESENRGGGRLQEVEKLLMEARVANARLIEDNESYQLLLQDKILKGDFKDSVHSHMNAPQSNDDALAALEGKSGGASLADEPKDAAYGEDRDDVVRRLEAEVRSIRDQNKALTLYLNRIMERLLQHQEYEYILDQSDRVTANTNKDLPPPPPPKEASGPVALQRAKSMALAGASARPRPMSMMPTAANLAQFSNPDTVSGIPFGPGRSQSTRRVRPMSEQCTGAASVVTQMYKGPDGPLSPSLRSSHTFFNVSQQRERNTSSATATSVPGNFPGMRSETSSVSGDSSSAMTGDKDTISGTPTQSPPREKRVTQKFDAGNKPRPLRLVQANKRQSWMGAWFSGAKKEEAVSPKESSIRE